MANVPAESIPKEEKIEDAMVVPEMDEDVTTTAPASPVV
jgi:hypothetical protein